MPLLKEPFRKVCSAEACRHVDSTDAEEMHRDVLPCLNLTWLSW
jgi:hypothetical protein